MAKKIAEGMFKRFKEILADIKEENAKIEKPKPKPKPREELFRCPSCGFGYRESEFVRGPGFALCEDCSRNWRNGNVF